MVEPFIFVLSFIYVNLMFFTSTLLQSPLMVLLGILLHSRSNNGILLGNMCHGILRLPNILPLYYYYIIY